MANSTFSGPVRSQNGFQELVNGVWTPVGSGGGGGGGGSALIASINVPLTITLTDIGQIITVVNNRSESENNSGVYTLTFNCPALTYPQNVRYEGKYLSDLGSGPVPLEVGSDTTITMTGASDFLLQFVFAGVYDSGGMGGPKAYVQLTGFTSVAINS